MKYLSSLLSIIITFLAVGAQAQSPIQHKVEVNHVRVFLRGAEMESKAKLTLPQGESEVLFTNIANDIINQSISVGADNGVAIQSITQQYEEPKAKKASVEAKAWSDSITIFKDQLELIEKKKEIIQKQLEYIDDNKKILEKEKSEASISELQKLIDLLGSKMDETIVLDNQAAKIKKQINTLAQKINSEQKKEFKPGGQLYVKFYSPKAVTANITISYVVHNAGWTPSYDIKAEKTTAPITLVYKAKVFQNTGINWNKVKLTISTGNPNEGAEAPILGPWNLSYEAPKAYRPVHMGAQLNMANIQMSLNGNVAGIIANNGDYDADDVDDEDDDDDEEAENALNNYVQVDNSGINTSFEIELPYTIPSDGKEHMVNAKNYELPATYRYYVVPKLDKDVFLQAQITKWESLSLLPGATNIFYQGYYVGEGMLDMRNVRDTLNISLGRDKKVVVRREKESEYQAPKFMSSNIQQWFGYNISVRNTKNESISLTILDQFPVSNDKSITVDDKSTSPQAMTNDKSGAIKWVLQLAPNEAKKLNMKYSVKYPKDKQIYNLR